MEHDYRDVLRKAASYVEQGWCQDSMYRAPAGRSFNVWLQGESQPTKRCALGAIWEATVELTGIPSNVVYNKLLARAEQALAKKVGSDPIEWNDAEGRTADEVAQALREAADA